MRKNHGNLWNQSSCNRLIAERIESRRHSKHISAVSGTRAQTDHSAPEEQIHLKNKVKTKKLQEDRAAEIQLENRILLQKMLNIDTKPSQFSADAMSASRHAPRSMHGPGQRKELDRITTDNQELLKRLQNVRSSVDPRIWDEQEMDRQALKYRMSQNSCRGRPLKLPMPQKTIGMSNLPRITGQGGRFREDDWARLTNSELDEKLLEFEHRQGSGSVPDLH